MLQNVPQGLGLEQIVYLAMWWALVNTVKDI
jgi:hypothetical protein